MKKFLISSLSIFTLFSGNSFANQSINTLNIFGGPSKMFEKKVNLFGLGLGTTVYENSGFLYGASLNIFTGYIGAKSGSAYSFDADFKGGYAILNNNLSLYGIVSGAYLLFNKNNNDASGFSYGGGIDYKIMDTIVLNLEYKTSTMYFTKKNVKNSFYDYDKIYGGVKIIF